MSNFLDVICLCVLPAFTLIWPTPSFKITLCKLGQKRAYHVFSTSLNTSYYHVFETLSTSCAEIDRIWHATYIRTCIMIIHIYCRLAYTRSACCLTIIKLNYFWIYMQERGTCTATLLFVRVNTCKTRDNHVAELQQVGKRKKAFSFYCLYYTINFKKLYSL